MPTDADMMGLRTQILDNLRYVNPFHTDPLIITSFNNGTWMAVSHYHRCYHCMSMPCDLFSGRHASAGAALSQLLEITGTAVFHKLYADGCFYVADAASDYVESYTCHEGENSLSVESDFMEWLPEEEREGFFYAMNRGGSDEYNSEEEEGEDDYHTMFHMMHYVGQDDFLGEGEVEVDGYLEEWIPEEHSLANSVDQGSSEWAGISH